MLDVRERESGCKKLTLMSTVVEMVLVAIVRDTGL